MIQNIASPLNKKSREEVENEINEETEKGLLLQLVRDYQVLYGTGSLSDNILLPYGNKKIII